jgi:Ca-activated chloride channel homolog
VRIEELVNYFPYDYAGPTDERPFAAHVEVAGARGRQAPLVRIGSRARDRRGKRAGREPGVPDRRVGLDEPANKLPLLKESDEDAGRQLGETIGGDRRLRRRGGPRAAADRRRPTPGRSSTRSTACRPAARPTAARASSSPTRSRAQLHPGGVNRVILAPTATSTSASATTASLVRLIEEKRQERRVPDRARLRHGQPQGRMLEQLSNKGNGNYAYIDTRRGPQGAGRADGGTLVTIAKDVKIQVEFNPAEVRAYRLIGYENRMLAAEDFNDDTKDAGEIGAGHTVTALYVRTA